jgi:predicted signal transduction protein with EAL and GGDEF domain
MPSLIVDQVSQPFQVAEGVETKEQQEFLTGLGCGTLQGFLLDRPMPAEQVLERVGQTRPGLSAATAAESKMLVPS